jgi:hypothetical protein
VAEQLILRRLIGNVMPCDTQNPPFAIQVRNAIGG